MDVSSAACIRKPLGGTAVLRSSFTPLAPMSPCPRVPSKAPPSLGRDGCPQPSVRRVSCAPRTSFYSRSGQRRVGDNPPYPRHREGRAHPTLIAPSGPRVLRSSFTPLAPMSPCPRVPSKAPPSLGRDGCPQPSVRRESCAPPTSFYSRSGQRRVGDNPPYPRQRGGRARPTQAIEGDEQSLPSTYQPINLPALPKNKEPRTPAYPCTPHFTFRRRRTAARAKPSIPIPRP